MKLGFLNALDGALGMGVSALGQAFKTHVSQFAAAQHTDEGGYRGRMGKSDLYYTDFGLRITSLLTVNPDSLASASRWVSSYSNPRNVMECFNYLNIRRILSASGYSLPVDVDGLLAVLHRQQLPSGGYRRPGGTEISAYHTFMAALCFEIMDMELPESSKAAFALQGLRRPDGGYCETSGEPFSQTNATAAAAACLTMCGAMTAGDAASTVGYISQMQTTTGGLLAHQAAQEADLLSTFTGMVCLFGIDDLNRLNLPSAARFIQSLLDNEGGFRASPSDNEPDVEYTYYGLGSLALLRVHMLAVNSE